MAKEKYVFRSFTSFARDEKFVLWRHDVDASVHSARRLALIEMEEQVKATYFFSLHSILYNLLEAEVTGLIRDIIGMGHDLGLHFDCGYYPVQNEDELISHLVREKRILEETFEKDVPVFSFHNTTSLALSCTGWEYGGLINAYAGYFRQEVGYCSDSNGYWRFRRLEDVLREGKDEKLHVLTHPEWRVPEALSPVLAYPDVLTGGLQRYIGSMTSG